VKRFAPHLLVFVTVAATYLAGIFTPLENAFTNVRFVLADRPATGSIAVVEIDARTLGDLEVWPWPREYHATLINRLVQAGATDIAFDVDFSSRSTVFGDAALATALRDAGNRVILPVFRQRAAPAFGEIGLIRTGPIPGFREHVRLASVNVTPDPDSLVRRYVASENWDGEQVPGMPAMLAAMPGPSDSRNHIDFGIRPDTIPRFSYIDILSGRFDPAAIAGRKIIVGATAVELGDQFSVPVYRTMPGPVLQAMAYESLVQDRMLARPGASLALLAALMIALAVGPRFTTWSWRRGVSVTAGGAVALAAVAFIGQESGGVLIDVMPVGATLVLCLGVGLIGRIDQQTLRIIIQDMSLRRVSARMRDVVENSVDGIVTFTGEGTIETANPAAGRIFGTTPDMLVGRHLASILPELEGRQGPPADFFLAQEYAGEAIGRRADGSELPLDVTVSSMESDGAPLYIGILRDITERKQRQAQLEYLAHNDMLTGIPNRKFLTDSLDDAVVSAGKTGGRLALLLLDLDGFKEINDTLGHPVGDTMLIEVGRRLTSLIGDDGIVTRLGGDEFGILVPTLARDEDARETGQRIVEAIERPYRVEELSLQVGASVGISLYPEHASDANMLLRTADIAMYAAKRDHARVAFYDAAVDRHSVRNLALSGDLREAIEGGQLSLHYQPQMDIESGVITGAEALVRWRHPQHGFISPAEFVPMAEQTGLVRRLNDWIIRRAIRQVSQWRRQGLDIAISINLSARNLHEETLPDRLAEIFDANGVEPARVTLEITESAIMIDPDRAMRVIQRISAIGVRLSIDDFGTGYSSLSYLKRLPVDEIKIDKSFVINMTEDASDAVIVRSTIDLAHNLGLKVVAEGIETEEHLARLAELRCDVGQGFLLGRPVPPAELKRLIQGPPGASDGLEKPALRVVAE
jgi:diguanylate cyclase (GGDEF)-like protein/PAS domain S-box-containing protein